MLMGGVAAGAMLPAPARAQDQPVDPVEASPPGDIVVTARRREETLLKVPVAITALTGEALAARGIASLQDLGNFVPGANIIGQATQGGRADRSFVGVVIRGMLPSTSAAQTTSMFIDGVPVSQATALQTLTNPARVEVLKGPQSATFGRQTFAGAINIVTKDPTDSLTGTVSGMLGTRRNYDLQAELSGPIFADLLGFRASGRTFGKNGSYRNRSVPGETLGDQSSKSASLALMLTPSSDLTIKAFGLYSELDDGPSAQGLISAYAVRDPSGRTVVADQSNCDVRNATGRITRFFCGVAPGLSGLTPSVNTENNAYIRNFLASPTGRTIAPRKGPDGYGLINRFYHIHLDTDYSVGDTGLSVRLLTGWNVERKSELGDLDNLNGTGFPPAAGVNPNEGFYNYPFLVEGRSRDFSQEVRIGYDQGGAFRLTVGGSYLNARNQSASGGPTIGGARRNGFQQSRTFGAFFSANYDFTPALKLSADGRYQIDKLSAFAGQGGVNSTGATIPVGFYPEGSEIAAETFRNFLPRVIAQYEFGEQMAYVSYSKGVNPGAFNTSFITALPPVVEEAQRLGYGIVIQPEKITNYEVGLKGKLFDNVLRYDLAAFYADWTDQIQSQTTTINVSPAPGRPPQPLQVVGSTNAGKVRIMGLEANLAANISRELTLDVTGAYIDSKIRRAFNTASTALFGITDFRGNENPFVSKWSAAVAANYTRPITDDLDGFGRVDFTYKSGSYSDVANIVRSPDLTQVNARLGVRSSAFTLEAFVLNVFNEKDYYNVVNGSLLAPAGSSAAPANVSAALIAQLRELRTIGLRGTYSF